MDRPVFHWALSVLKNGISQWEAHCCLLWCEAGCWIELKPYMIHCSPVLEDPTMLVCMPMLLPSHIWLLLKLASGFCHQHPPARCTPDTCAMFFSLHKEERESVFSLLCDETVSGQNCHMQEVNGLVCETSHVVAAWLL